MLTNDHPEFPGGNTIGDYPAPQYGRLDFETIKATHLVNVAPVYSTSGHMVFPQDWYKALSGSIVECYFGLSHTTDYARDLSEVSAELMEVVVLRDAVDAVEHSMKARGEDMEWFPHCIEQDVKSEVTD